MKTNQLKSINPKNTLEIRSWDVFSQNKIETIIKNSSDAQIIWKTIEKIEMKINRKVMQVNQIFWRTKLCISTREIPLEDSKV